MRDLTRERTKLVHERSREGNRVQGGLERANLQVAAVAPDIMGVSGRALLAAWVTGQVAPATMAELAKGRRTKHPRWEQAVAGLRRDSHRRLLTLHLAPSDGLDEQIDALRVELLCALTALEPSGAVTPPSAAAAPVGEATGLVAPRQTASPLSLAQAVTVLAPRPGVDQRGAERLVAAWGPDMSRFGTASCLSAWYQRLATRRGSKRAIMAGAQAIVVSAFPLLCRHEPYRERGATSGDEPRRNDLVNHVTRQLERLGYHVQREPVQPASH